MCACVVFMHAYTHAFSMYASTHTIHCVSQALIRLVAMQVPTLPHDYDICHTVRSHYYAIIKPLHALYVYSWCLGM